MSRRQRFRDLPIKHKLIAINMLTAGVALAMASLALAGLEFYNFRNNIMREMTTIAQMIAASTGPAMTFGDRRAAADTLSILKREPRIVAACLYDSGNRLFAHYPIDESSCGSLSPDKVQFESDFLTLSQPVLLDQETSGRIVLKSNLVEMYDRLRTYAGIVLAVFFAAVFAALIISSSLQTVISHPVFHLAEMASMVSTRKDFSFRARKTANDEIGLLVDRFNEMMSQIQERDYALKLAQDELEDRVRQRTEQLQDEIAVRLTIEGDLIQAKEAAEESDKAKSAFLANMSHELRTPLNAIIGYSEMLEEDARAAGNAGAVQDLRRILTSAKHLLMLIQDILDLSKIEAGRMTLHYESVPVQRMLEEALETAQPLARKNNNQLEVKCDPAHQQMVVDPTRFRQSLFNLLSNACKFTEAGKVTLEVEKTEEDGRQWMHWHVRDTGIGIAPEQMQKLFQSFSQVDGSATRKYGGTGLGLAISQRFCQMMGGDILVDSEPGKGSTFTIRIPMEGGS